MQYRVGVERVWGIFRRDLKAIFTNPVAIIVTIGIAILPSAYAWLNIIANWDPYANTSAITVAVANLDRGGSSDLTGSLNVGEQLEDQLKKNTQLGWTFVKTKNDAVDGVKSGKYYASIVIDEQFSQQLLDMVTASGPQPELEYYVNEKLNPIAPKITDTGATTLDRTLNSTFVSTVAKTVSEKLNISTDDAKKLIQGAHAESIAKIDDTSAALTQMKQKVGEARTSLEDTARGIQSSKNTLSTVRSAVSSAQNSARSAARTADTLTSTASTFSAKTSSSLASAGASLSLLGIQAGQAGSQMSAALGTASTDVATVNGTLTTVIAQNDAAIAQLQTVLDNAANSGLDTNSGVYTQMQQRLDALRTLSQNQKQALAAFTSGTQQALTAANAAAGSLSSSLGSAAVSGGTALNAAASGLGSDSGAQNGAVSGSLVSSLQSASAFSMATATALGQLGTSIDQAQTLLDQISGLLTSTAQTMGTTESSLDSTLSQLTQVRTDMAALDSSQLVQALRGTNVNTESVASFMLSPIQLEQKRIYPVKNYGSAIAPFFTNVALWVGGFTLIALVQLDVKRQYVLAFNAQRRARGQRKLRNRDLYMGRWLLFAAIGVVQAVVATVGDLIIGIQMENPVAFVFAGVVASLVFVSLIYALASTFRHIGKALAVIIVVMQVPGSSGTYPIEIMPEFFRKLEPWLPFTYSNNVMRETIGGFYEGRYWQNLGMLLLFGVFSFVLGLVVRPYLMNLNNLFDRRLADTDLLVGKAPQGSRPRFRLSSAVQSFMRHDEFGRSIRRRAARFAQAYPKLVAWGIGIIFVIPVLFLVLLFTVEAKLVFLMLWLISVVLIDFYLIGLEYVREIYERELGMSELSEDALRAQVLERIVHKWSHEDSADGAENSENSENEESADSTSDVSRETSAVQTAKEGE
ncbi:YhgE/Pip domain-containing protein [Alloscardovia macacae]|uniref:YhgE/Pip domain-containing protein n=1 Tax=Alloscardovia macacae TaxID=1160091 RepID=UPI0015D8145E|nr:YhgE/Pip domain-containing protein [Alloscardovia macacae]